MRDVLLRMDLNLLLALDALIEERSVTRAAERMHVGQPAMSASLARLRALFSDPLLERAGREMTPTPRALALIAPIRHALLEIEAAVQSSQSFRPEVDSRTFTIMASDYVLLVFLGPLLAQLRAEAPNVSFQVTPVAPDFDESVRRSRVDLLVYPDELVHDSADLGSALLFTDRLVCAVASDHPDVGETLTSAQFATLPWVSFGGSHAPTISEARLASMGFSRPAEIVAQSFVIQPFLLPGTRLVALFPERLGEHFRELIDIRLLNPPMDMAPMKECVYWSRRYDTDPGHLWLRSRLIDAGARLAN